MDAQLDWEAEVRAQLIKLGFDDPEDIEAEAEGFGQDFAAWGGTAAEYAAMVAEAIAEEA